jgi:nucleotide-binding universal stress UspA family protein
MDGSDAAYSALELAIELQKKFDSELFILCVYRHYSLLEASMSMVNPERPENLEDSMREYASNIVENAKKFAEDQGSKSIRGFVKAGQPARTIVNFAKDKNINLIVLGSRGLGDVEGYLLGSVSHKVTSLAHCPTMVV